MYSGKSNIEDRSFFNLIIIINVNLIYHFIFCDNYMKYKTIVSCFSVKTDLLPGGAMSRLYIANANRLDSGNYSCSLADVAGTTVAVHVLNGE